MPGRRRPQQPRTPRPEDFGAVVREHAWPRLQASFEAWATDRAEVLRGYRRREVYNYNMNSPNLQSRMAAVETERMETGSFNSRSSLVSVFPGMPGSVRSASEPQRPPEIQFSAGLPTPYLSEHPEARDIVMEAVAHASRVTGLDLAVFRDVRGGSNWVIEGRLDPAPKPAPEMDAEPEEPTFRP